MSALTVLLIRHGEKPEADKPEWGPGLTMVGHEDAQSLVVRGWQRAGVWAALFGSGLKATDFPRPDLVYAADPNKEPVGEDTTSKRPWETVLPLCQRLGKDPVTTYSIGDEAALIAEVREQTGIVLISWEHKKIVEAILPGLAPGVADLPIKWKRDRFDLALRLDRSGPEDPWQFRQLFPQLLAGDSANALKA